MIKNIVFDLDGTLLNTKLVDLVVIDRLYRDFGVPRNITEKFYTLLKFQPFKDGISSVAYRKYLWEFVIERKSNLGFHYYEWWENTRKKAIEESYNSWLLDSLTKEGFRIFIATAGDTYTQSMKLAYMNVNYPFFVFDRQNGFDKLSGLSWDTFFRLFGLGKKDTLVIGNNFDQDIVMPFRLGRKVAIANWLDDMVVQYTKLFNYLESVNGKFEIFTSETNFVDTMIKRNEY